ncbi:MAG: glycosyltransferase family 39 protein [Candidatus Liptonbacteria bacterium]|nr:glycosyltransferase family 39 protein [Candidatus Liptonbacteria bacterium]
MTRALLVILCALSLVFLFSAARGDSMTMDEQAHIPAGYAYAKYLDYRLNPEHPPLLKFLAGFPLRFLNLNFPTDRKAWTEEVNGQWEVGKQFIFDSGNDADLIVGWARVGPILLTLLFILLLYHWAREIVGSRWALLPTLLFGLSPNILAHGHYVTTDIAAAFGIVLGTYYFLRIFSAPTGRNILLAGLAFGVAQIAKFSTVLLIPYFIFLVLAFIAARWLLRRTDPLAAPKTDPSGGRLWLALLLTFVIGYVAVVYPAYALLTKNYPMAKQTSDTTFILASFGGGPAVPGASCNVGQCLAQTNIWMTRHALTRPIAEYVLGVLMVLQRSAGGNTGYFLGQVSAAGSHLYFPIMYLLKEPLPSLLIVLTALLGTLWGIGRKLRNRLPATRYSLLATRSLVLFIYSRFTEFAMLVMIGLYWLWSITSPLNIGFRHILPTLPLIYILATVAWEKWAALRPVPTGDSVWRYYWNWLKSVGRSWSRHLLLLALIIWFLLETIFTAPYFLSYYNQLGGGVWGGYRIATDSSYDWGQDLKRLTAWVEERNQDPDPSKHVDGIAVDYFGGAIPGYYLKDKVQKVEGWWSARGNPAQTQINADTETQINADGIGDNPRTYPRESAIRWLAVSINSLEGAIQPGAPGFVRKPEDEYRWLTALRPPAPGLGNVPEPDYRIGTSIFVYKL